MTVGPEDVLHIAKLARIAIDESELPAIAAELSSILGHMADLERVDTKGVATADERNIACTPLRPDHGPPIPLAEPLQAVAPETRDGFLLVPRLATHGDDVDRAP